jgi:ribosomal protein S18 acetylase RimI-like enzyme
MAAHIAAKLGPSQFRAWASDGEHALIVAERELGNGSATDPAIVGYALVALGQPDGHAEAAAVHAATGMPGPYLELSKIYVLPGERGSGVADLLMTGAIDAATRLAADTGHPPGLPLWLGTNRHNTRAQGFYRRHGFDVVGERTYDVGGVEHDDMVMLHTTGER